MSLLRRIFSRRRDAVRVVDDSVLPPHVYAAIGAAMIHARGSLENDKPPVIQFDSGKSFHFVREEISGKLSACFPGLSAAQLREAITFLNNRIIATRRMHAELSQFHDVARKRWSAKDW